MCRARARRCNIQANATRPVAVNNPGVIYGSVALGHSYSIVAHSTPLAIQAPTPEKTPRPLLKELARAMLKALRAEPKN